MSDFTLLHTRRQTEDSWSQQIKTAITQLKGEYERYGTQMLGLTLTPYIIGQPFRIQALQDLLQHMASLDGVSICTAQHIHDAYQKAQP